jgi:DNA-binding CsgD family transcriptional regulator/PAS domain-containing protein
MASDAELRRLTAAIYEAAVDPKAWRTFLRMLADSVEGGATSLLLFDTNRMTGNIGHTVNMDPVLQRRYAEHYSSIDGWGLGAQKMYLEQGRVFTGEELWPEERVPKGEFYSDWLRPLNCFHQFGGVILRQGSLHCVVASMRSKRAGPFGVKETAVLKQLLPHLQRAVQFQRKMAGIDLIAKAAMSALDHLSQGVLVVEMSGKVIFLNRAAEGIINSKDGLSIQRSVLSTAIPQEARHLQKLIRDASRLKVRDTKNAGAMAVSRPSLKRPFSVLVTPVPGDCMFTDITRPCAIVFVTDPEVLPEADKHTLCRIYGVTKAEAEIALRLTEGKSLADVCDLLDISRNTAKTHLKSLFDKLGVHRQGELVAVVTRSVGSLRSS